jgi:hypothetical protein
MGEEPAEEDVVADDVGEWDIAAVARGIGGPAVVGKEFIDGELLARWC